MLTSGIHVPLSMRARSADRSLCVDARCPRELR
jgi:hypothetical protein